MDSIIDKWLALANRTTKGWAAWQIHLQHTIAIGAVKRHQISEDRATEFFRIMYEHDLAIYTQTDLGSLALAKDLQIVGKSQTKKKYYFVTIGFDDNTITIPAIRNTLKRLNEVSGLELDSIVAEKFRKDNNGKIYEHHHIHALYNTDFAKSKVIQYIYQKVQKLVQGKNFIDVKNEQSFESYKQYILGNKTSTKLECIQLDKIWREKNNL